MSRRKMPAGLRRYWAKHRKTKRKHKHRRKRKATHVAKKRHHRHTRRRHHGGHRRRRRSGGGGGFIPPREDLMLMGAAAAMGFLESKAKAEADFILNKIPRPIAQLGYTGGTAIALWLGAKFTHNRWLRLAARGTAVIAAYQFGSKGGAPGAGVLQLSGWQDEISGPEEMIDMAGLAADGDAMSGLPYDDRVESPMT